MAASESAQALHEELLRSRGWETARYKTLDAGLRASVTQDTRQAYTIEILQSIGKDDAAFMQSCIDKGVNPNTCNAFGQTLLHHACRHSAEKVFEALVAAGADVCAADDCGKTPMHDCVWSAMPSFKIAARILDINEAILRGTDRLNATPLEYAHPSKVHMWRQFLAANAERWWPHKALSAPPVKGNTTTSPELPTQVADRSGTPPLESPPAGCEASAQPVSLCDSQLPAPHRSPAARTLPPTSVPSAAHTVVHNASWLAIRSFARAIAAGASFSDAATPGVLHAVAPSLGAAQDGTALLASIPPMLPADASPRPTLIPAGPPLGGATARVAPHAAGSSPVVGDSPPTQDGHASAYSSSTAGSSTYARRGTKRSRAQVAGASVTSPPQAAGGAPDAPPPAQRPARAQQRTLPRGSFEFKLSASTAGRAQPAVSSAQ